MKADTRLITRVIINDGKEEIALPYYYKYETRDGRGMKMCYGKIVYDQYVEIEKISGQEDKRFLMIVRPIPNWHRSGIEALINRTKPGNQREWSATVEKALQFLQAVKG